MATRESERIVPSSFANMRVYGEMIPIQVIHRVGSRWNEEDDHPPVQVYVSTLISGQRTKGSGLETRTMRMKILDDGVPYFEHVGQFTPVTDGGS